MGDRWPWNRVRGFKVESLANGNMLVTPDWIDAYKGPMEGGGPGLMTRLEMAEWIAGKIERKRGTQGRPASRREQRG